MQTASILLLLSFMGTMPASDPALASYHSDALHITFAYPQFLKLMPGVANDALNEAKSETQNALACVSIPFMAAEEATTTALLMMRLDLDCMKAPVSKNVVGPIAQNALQEGLTKLGEPTVGSIASYDLDGHDASFVQASAVDGGGNKAFAAATCVLIDKSAVCWEVLSKSKETVQKLVQTSINFDGRGSQPLVPTNLFYK